MTAALLLLAALALVVVCGLFVAAEFSFLAVDRPSVERLADSGSRSARGVLAALRTLSTQLSGVQVAITLTNLAIGLLAEPSLAALLEPPLRGLGLSGETVPTIAVAVGLTVSTMLTMLFGELVPKNLAIALPMRVARLVQRPVRAFTRTFAWPIRALNRTAEAILHRFGLEAQEELASARSAEELIAVVRRSEEQGALETDTAELLTRSLLFGRRRAHDAMTPRVRVHSVPASEPARAVIDAAASTGHSRFPVIGRDIDEVVGVVHVKAALAVPHGLRNTTRISSIAQDPVLVPSSLPLDELMDVLQERDQLAVVVDEYGGTHGVVTLEDLVEELVGEVEDEFDPGVEPRVTAIEGGWSVPAVLRPDEVAWAIDRDVPTGGWTTVAGLFLAHFQSLPRRGDTVNVAGLRWTVVAMEGRRIVTLEVRPDV